MSTLSRRLFRGMGKTLTVAGAATLCGGILGCVLVVDGGGGSSRTYVRGEAVKPIRLGVELRNVDEALARQIGVAEGRSTLIERVTAGSAADRAGIARFDVVTEIDGDSDASPNGLRRAIRAKSAGEEMRLRIVREGAPREVVVVMGEQGRAPTGYDG